MELNRAQKVDTYKNTAPKLTQQISEVTGGNSETQFDVRFSTSNPEFSAGNTQRDLKLNKSASEISQKRHKESE